MRTAVIGLGNIGTTVARLLTAGGVDVIVSDRDWGKAEETALMLGPHAKAMSPAQAVDEGDVVILAIWLDAIEQFVGEHRSSLSGKIVVDPSNPIAPDGKGGFDRTLPASRSSGQVVAGKLPTDAELVKAFGTLGAPSLRDGAHRQPEPAVLFYATDFPEAGRAVAKLIAASGFWPVSVGGIDQSIRIEVGGDLHEYGKLGKMVSADEAEALLNS